MVGNITIKKGAKLFAEQETTIVTDSLHVARDVYLSLKDKIKQRGFFLGKATSQRMDSGVFLVRAGVYYCNDSREKATELEAIFTPAEVANKNAFDALFID